MSPLNPFAIYYPAYHAAYIKVNKAATQAITAAADNALGSGGKVPGGIPEAAFVFAFVRNPYDRLVSTWMNQVARPTKFSKSLFQYKNRGGMHKAFWRYPGMRPDMDFPLFAKIVSQIPDWQANPHFKSQWRFLEDEVEGGLMPDFIGRFENLQADFDRVVRHLGANPAPVPVVNRTPRRALWPAYYSKELAELVYNRYAVDFELFGYERTFR